MPKYKFEFTLDAQDTENFLGILHNNIINMMARRLDLDVSDAEKEWLKKHIKYLEEMKQTIIDGHTRL